MEIHFCANRTTELKASTGASGGNPGEKKIVVGQKNETCKKRIAECCWARRRQWGSLTEPVGEAEPGLSWAGEAVPGCGDCPLKVWG